MKTFIVLEVEHTKPVIDLAEKIAGRAYMIQGVDSVHVNMHIDSDTCEVVRPPRLEPAKRVAENG